MGYKTIESQKVEEGIEMLCLNRPRRYNSVNHLMMEELEVFWAEKKNDLKTNVIILKGNGKRGFCAGLDMKESVKTFDRMTTDEFYRFQSRLARLTLAMRRAPQPIICSVHGAAAGLGFSFALASDIRIVTGDARFSAAYINIGLGGADMACSYFLPRLIGAGRAYEFMLTGDSMTAQQAFELGLVSRMVERDDLIDNSVEMAKQINSKNSMGVRLTKEAINMNLDSGGLEQALNLEDRNQSLLVARAMLGEGEKSSRYF